MAAVIALVASPQTAFASVSSTHDSSAVVNGPVFAMVQVGSRTIIGGSFTRVGGQPRQNLAAIGPDGKVEPDFAPTTDGAVHALAVSSDAGRVFVGGLFANVQDTPRANLAAVDATSGALVTDWQADTVGIQPQVLSLAVAGSNVYVGGYYSGIDGTSRKRLVALDTTGTGDVIDGFRPAPNAFVKAIALSPDGTKLYAGGSFTEIGGQVRLHSAAELLATTGEATAFDPSEGGGRVTAVGPSPDGSRLYFGTENNTLFAYDLNSAVPAWFVKTSGNTQTIAVSPTEVYIGGHFSQVVTYKIQRNLIASLNPVDGTVTSWNPLMEGRNKGVWSIVLTPTHLLAGGGFITINGVKQKGFARFAGTP